MAIANDIQQLHADMRRWRQHLHRYPETAFEETATAQFIADKLTSFGLDVHQGLGKTGVVGTLSAGNGNKKIALRADMDALFIEEQNILSTFRRSVCSACTMSPTFQPGISPSSQAQ